MTLSTSSRAVSLLFREQPFIEGGRLRFQKLVILMSLLFREQPFIEGARIIPDLAHVWVMRITLDTWAWGFGCCWVKKGATQAGILWG